MTPDRQSPITAAPTPQDSSGPVSWFTAGCVVIVVLLAGLLAIHWSPLLVADRAADRAAHPDVLTQPWLLAGARAATTIGSPPVVDVVATLAGLVLLILRRWRAVVLVVVARLGELACESGLKALIARPRPILEYPLAHASGYSFPSGHAGGAAALYGSLVLLASPLLRRWARVLLWAAGALLVAAVAASRVLLGVHYPSDVTAGVALGLAWVGMAALSSTLPTPSLPDRKPVKHPSVLR
jgi:membrane-associated phospholipid phosphatase